MNRLTYIGILTVLAFVFMGGLASASMYWDRGQDPDETVSRTTRQAEPRAATPRSERPALLPKMYDDNEVLQLDEDRQEAAVSRPPIQYRPPAVSPTPPASRRIVPPPAYPPRQPAATRGQSTQRRDTEQVRPQAVDSAPGQAPEKRTEPRAGQPGESETAPAGELEALEPPTTKKMPWGREETPEPKTNLKWGKPTQEER